MKNKYTSFVLFFLLFFFLGASFLKARWNYKGAQAPICWDGFGYYFYLPTYFYDDFKSFKQYDYIQKNYSPTAGDLLGVKRAPNGNWIMRYPIGASFLYFPGFIVGHVSAKIAGYPVDGFSLPYQFAMSIWTTLFGMIGLWVLSRLLLRYFSDTTTAISLLILGLATNVFFYMSFTQLHTHIYLFTVYATILWLTDTFYQKEKYNYAFVIAIGLLCGLATACRPTEIISCLIPLFWKVADWNSMKARIHTLLQEWKVPLLFVVMAFVGVSPLLLYWKLYSGQWFFYSYEDDQTFSFLHPHIINFLFSYKKGWLTYTPVMYTAIVGFYWLWKYKRNIFVPVAIFSLLNLYLISSWDCWWYGGSFSQRAIIQSYPLLMFPFASFIAYISSQKMARLFFCCFIVFCTWLNFTMTYQAVAEGDIMESDSMTKAYFWRIFGKTSIGKYDRKMLDTDEELPPQFESSLILIDETGFEGIDGNDSTTVYEGKCALHLGNNLQWVYGKTISIANRRGGWFRAKAKFYFPNMEWNKWKWAQFYVVLKSKDGVEKVRSIRAQRGLEQGKWADVFVDIKNNERKQFDSLQVRFWNAGGKADVYFDNMQLYYTSTK